MQYLLFVTLFLVSFCYAFAGRAFPVESENHVIKLFSAANGELEWDVTNFLVDLAGQYAICKNRGRHGSIPVERKTPEGDTIGALVVSTPGPKTHVDAVHQYIMEAVSDWTETKPFKSQILKATKFGCSVQPGCEGHAVIACLFSPEYVDEQPPWEPEAQQVAKAFTKEQYALTEKRTGQPWDRSHLLENLSGFETSCSMVNKNSETWEFPTAEAEAAKRGFKVFGQMGSAVNRGNTQGPLTEIIDSFKQDKLQGRQLGCSVIPDCMHTDGNMYVVVSCLSAY